MTLNERRRKRRQEDPEYRRRLNEYQREYWRTRRTDETRKAQRERSQEYRRQNPHLAFHQTSRYLANKAGVYTNLSLEDAQYIHNLPDVCSYCGKERQPSDGKRSFHNDHIIPMIQGGPNVVWNITKSCNSCNTSKGSGSLIDFYGRNDNFTADKYESVVVKMVELSGLTRENIDLLLEQSFEFELLHRKQREKLTSILSQLSIAN